MNISETVSDKNGNFDISYRTGSSAHLFAEAPGYKIAEAWAAPGDKVRIGLLSGKSTSRLETTSACNHTN